MCVCFRLFQPEIGNPMGRWVGWDGVDKDHYHYNNFRLPFHLFFSLFYPSLSFSLSWAAPDRPGTTNSLMTHNNNDELAVPLDLEEHIFWKGTECRQVRFQHTTQIRINFMWMLGPNPAGERERQNTETVACPNFCHRLSFLARLSPLVTALPSVLCLNPHPVAHIILVTTRAFKSNVILFFSRDHLFFQSALGSRLQVEQSQNQQ